MKRILLLFLIISTAFVSSCESETEKKERLFREEQQRIAIAKKRADEERQLAIIEKFNNNSLRTGATPYDYCYGTNSSCQSYGCSEVKVKTPGNSDVIVTLKQNGEVVRHAYIQANSSFTFEVPNGSYQPFFYYGKGWNPEKVMTETECGQIKGGFVQGEHFGKDSPQNLQNAILQYELILQSNGNFQTRPSNPEEAF